MDCLIQLGLVRSFKSFINITQTNLSLLHVCLRDTWNAKGGTRGFKYDPAIAEAFVLQNLSLARLLNILFCSCEGICKCNPAERPRSPKRQLCINFKGYYLSLIYVNFG